MIYGPSVNASPRGLDWSQVMEGPHNKGCVFIGTPVFNGPREAVIDGGVSRGPLAGQGFSFTLRHAGDRWSIVSEKGSWIS